MESSSKLVSSESPTTPTLDSSSELLFPTLATDTRLTFWVEEITKKTMTVSNEYPSDDKSLGESAYEFIDTDEESRDDNATESVASIEFGRPDDITSIEGTECSVDDSEEEDLNESHHSVLLDHTVEEAFNSPTIGRCSQREFVDEIDNFLPQLIEFEEPLDTDVETIRVKHIIAHLNEDQTENFLQGISVENQPERLIVTIRQTMTKRGLSTREPLRIIYVGSHSAKQDIIHKIASCVTASVESETHVRNLHYSTSQLYNVVPISAFVSERTPEIELMHSSGYQIKVDDCHLALIFKDENRPEKPDVIKLFLDGHFECRSVPSDETSFTIEPGWELPHIAVFHCSDGDDTSIRQTRAIAWQFMSRHCIPSIVISHKLMFDWGQCMSLDEHSLHMCLESKDLNGIGTTIHQKLPIYLSTFLSIDARQMNRNLAYLTGLHGSLDSSNGSTVTEKGDSISTIKTHGLESSSSTWRAEINLILNQGFPSWTAALSFGIFLLGIFIATLKCIPSYKTASVPEISVNSKLVSTASILSPPTTSFSLSSTLSALSSFTSTATVKNSIQTTTVTQYFPPALNCLAKRHSMENVKVPACSGAHKYKNSFACTAEIYGDKDILIRIPAANRLTWFNSEVISVNITRANMIIDTERAYSSNEGIILSLPRNEAYGVVKVSIATTKKPRMRETFVLDFGSITSQFWKTFKTRMLALIPTNSNLDAKYLTQTGLAASDAFSKLPLAFSGMSGLRIQARERLTRASDTFATAANSFSFLAFKHTAMVSKLVGTKTTEAQKALIFLKRPILLAQIQSKLSWLKVQGKYTEAKQYRERAVAALTASGTRREAKGGWLGRRQKS